MRLDRALALALLAFSVGYGYLAWRYPLLPFERGLPFKPNTLPIGLAVVGSILSIIVAARPGDGDGLSEDAAGWRAFDWRAAGGVFVLALLYAAAIRPLGYLPATTAFLVAGPVLLGERKLRILIPVAAGVAFFTWLIVHHGLGVFLRPWPAFWS